MALKNFKTKNGIDVDSYTIPSSSVQTTVKTSSATTLDTIALSSFKSVEYLVTISQAAKTRSSKVTLQTDGTSVDMTEYAITETGGSISGVVVSATVVSTNVLLQITVSDAATTLARVVATKNSGDLFKSVISDAPVIGTATAAVAGEASVAFTAPYDDGASTITSYTAFSNTGGYSGTLSQAGSGSIPVVDMVTGNYTFTVKATNANGISQASSSSNSVSVTSTINTWVTKAAMTTGRYDSMGAVVGTSIYVIGGSSAYKNEAYDTVTNTWTTKAASSYAEGTAGAVVGTKIYRFNARFADTVSQAYDTVANTWTTKASSPVYVWRACAAAVGTKIYLMGGITSETASALVNNNQVYDTVANTWSTAAVIPEILSRASAVTVGTKIYVVGGFGQYNNYKSELRVYDTVADTWTSLASLPRTRGNSYVGYSNGYIYSAGGQVSGTPQDENYAYNISTNTWSTMAPVPMTRSTGASGMVGSKFFNIGGTPGGTDVNYMYQT